MVLFDFKSDKHFVASSDKTTLQVYEWINLDVNPSSIRNTHWEEVATITACDRDQSDDEEDEGDDDDEAYEGLMFFDGHGKIEGREALTRLAQHLTRMQLRVSPQGFCFQDVTTLGEHKAFGLHYLRLNDLFNWSYHGIKTPSVATWRRLVLEYTVPKREKRPAASGGVSKEMYEEMKKAIGKKDEELEKLREEVEKLKGEKEEMTKENAAETKKLRDQLSQLPEELEQRRNQSWLLTATTKLMPLRQYIESDQIKIRRRPVPRDTWSLSLKSQWGSFRYGPSNNIWPFGLADSLSLVDEDPKDWLPPPKINVNIYESQFDIDNWWFVKIAHPNGSLTMMAYYDGNNISGGVRPTMVLFDFKFDKHFVASSDRATLQVYELTNPTANPSSIRKNHWKEVATITARDHDQSDDDEVEVDDHKALAEEEESSYHGLMFFDGHGEIEGWEALTKLAQHLTRLQLRVSPQGFCFQDVTGLGEHKAFGLHYLRLNDLFDWSYHGIRMTSNATWPRRSVLKYLIPGGEKRPTPTAGGGVSKEMYEELEKTVGKKDEELEKLREEVEKLKGEKEEMMKENASETKKLREQLSQLPQELEQRRKQSWLLTATTKLVPLRDPMHGGLIKSRRRPVPRDTWSTPRSELRWGTFWYWRKTGASNWPFTSVDRLSLVDEDPKDWLPPPKIKVHIYDSQFDIDNWWFVKTVHPNGGLTMMAYYDGNNTISSVR
ncbi:unnamed protein product, partial [Linum tenue]